MAWRHGAWRIVLLGATFGAGQTLCFWESIKTLETSIAVLLFYTYPAVTLAIDRLVFRQRVRPLALLCVAAILCGAALITGPGLHHGALDPRGLAWAIPAPLLYAVYLAVNTRLLRRHPALIGATGLYLGLAVTFGLMSAWLGLDIPKIAAGWALLLFVGLGPGAITMTLFTYSVPRLGASSFAILANTELVVVVSIGAMALFNAPARQDDHPVRAARAALAMQAAVEATAASSPGWPRFRVGINTGPALVGNIGSTALRSFNAMGDAVNVAARLESVAQPGQVVIGESTRVRLPAGAAVESLGELAVKGRRSAVVAYRLFGLHRPHEPHDPRV